MAKDTQPSKFQRKIDHFLAGLFLTPEGKLKSALLLYSFCLSLLFTVVYIASYFFLIDVLEHALAAAPVAARNIAQALIPGLLGTLICCAAWFLPGDKRLLPYTYYWQCAYALFALIVMALMVDAQEYSIFLYFFMTLALTGLISGVLVSQLLYRGRMRKQTIEKKSWD